MEGALHRNYHSSSPWTSQRWMLLTAVGFGCDKIFACIRFYSQSTCFVYVALSQLPTRMSLMQGAIGDVNELFKNLDRNASIILDSELSLPAQTPPSAARWLNLAIWPAVPSGQVFCGLSSPPALTRACAVMGAKHATIQNGIVSMWVPGDSQLGCLIFDSSCEAVAFERTTFKGAAL